MIKWIGAMKFAKTLLKSYLAKTIPIVVKFLKTISDLKNDAKLISKGHKKS